MGTPEFAVCSLQALLDNDYQVLAVFTTPDRKKGRGQAMAISPVKELALKHRIQLFQPEFINKEEWIGVIEEINPDLIVVAAYGQIISKAILDIPKYGCINVHASLLPKYRGASPIHFALLNGETETGVTIMKLDEGMDTGEIIHSAKIKILKHDNLETLHDKLAVAGADLLVKTLPGFLKGKFKPYPQDDDLATYSKILTKKDGRINWEKSSDKILNMIRAYNPWPGTFTNWEGKCLKILAAEISEREFDPGKIVIEGSKFYIGTADKAISVTKLQMEGRRCLLAEEFVRGCNMIDGYYCK